MGEVITARPKILIADDDLLVVEVSVNRRVHRLMVLQPHGKPPGGADYASLQMW